MCEQSYSESGACFYIKGCKEFLLVSSDRDRLAGVVQGMEEQNTRNVKELHWHNQRLVEVTKERDALLKVREAADVLVDALSNKCRSCEEACNHCGFRREVKAYKEVRDVYRT